MSKRHKTNSARLDAVIEFGVPSFVPLGVLVQFGAGWALMAVGVVWSAVGVARAKWGRP